MNENAKELEAQQLRKDIKAFLVAGGKIQKLKNGDTGIIWENKQAAKIKKLSGTGRALRKTEDL